MTASLLTGRAPAAWLRRAVWPLALALALSGCSEKSINVAEAEIAPEQTTATLTDSAEQERAVYFQDDEAVRLDVRFDVNFVAVYKSYYAWWYFPNGRLYLRQPVRNRFASHLSLVTALPIRDQPPAAWPGRWKVRLTLRNRTLVEREFEIREGTRTAAGSGDSAPSAAAAVAAAEAAPQPRAAPEPALCPDAGSPPGWCNWAAPEERGDGTGSPVTVAARAPPPVVADPATRPPAAAQSATAAEAPRAAAVPEPDPAETRGDLASAQWIPLPFEPVRQAPPAQPCLVPGADPARCRWLTPDDDGQVPEE